MTDTRNPPISLRKQPKQSRSAGLVSAVLEAAIQVLVEEGAPRFTMARVAEKAGASVGSLYQYFPNKAAILFRLQSDEWRETHDLLRTILEDSATPPPARVRRLVHAFLRSECEEAAVRMALDDAAPLYRDQPEAKAAKAGGTANALRFLEEAAPDASDESRRIAADLIGMTLSGVGRDFSGTPRSDAEIAAYADALADMLCAYLEALRR